MKNLKIALGMVSVLAILILVSCGKGTSPTPPPDPPPSQPKVSISATAPAKGWYGDNLTGTVTAQNAVSVTASQPATILGNSYTVPSVTGPTNVQLIATGADRTKAETTVIVEVYSQKLSLLCKKGVWHGTTITINGGIPSSWSTYHYTFTPDYKVVANGSYNGGIDSSPADFIFDETTNKLTFGGTEWTVSSLTEAELVLTRLNGDNLPVVVRYRH